MSSAPASPVRLTFALLPAILLTMEYLFDTHTHSDYSHDGVPPLETAVLAAVNKGMKYLAVTDHCDKDCAVLPGLDWVRQIDLVSRKREMTALKRKYADRIVLADGLEYGYAPEADALYLQVEKEYPSDYVINSVHVVEGVDIYMREFFDARTKKQAYTAYLEAVRASVDAPYGYDAIGHLGYIARKATYPDKRLLYEDYADLVDEILKAVVEKGKALEINTASKGTKCDLYHDPTIIKRYKSIGGELVTIGSDAHDPSRFCDDFENAAAVLVSCGFRYAFVYENHVPKAVALDK